MQRELLETFLDLCTTASFHRTAERLGVTQSTVSARLKALETLLGVRLFQRSRRGAALTTEGLRFEPHARALLRGWEEARRAAQGSGAKALTVRVGIQHDVAEGRVGDWLTAFRQALPEAAFYLELDYSTQMCADLASGALDFAVLYTPKPDPELFFVSLGTVTHVMVSTHAERLAEVALDRYVLGNYAPAFASAHALALPHLGYAPVASGQDTAVAALIVALHGSGYVTAATAARLSAEGLARPVVDAPTLTQPVYAAMLTRARTARLQQALLRIVQKHFRAAG